MSRKFLMIFLVLISCFSVVFVLTGCDVTNGGNDDDAMERCEHTYGEWSTTLEPTCTVNGSKEQVCSKCNDVHTETISATGHSYGEWTITTPATCTVAGSKNHTCSKCSDIQTANIPATGHSEVTDNAVAPTCTEAGKTAGSHCSVCSAIIVAQEEVSALGHTETGFCTRCSSDATNGIVYTEDEGIVRVTGVGTATANDIVIAGGYNGKSVKRLDVGAFRDNTSITSITIPSTVTYLWGAFIRCSGLTSVVVDANNRYYKSEGNCIIDIDTNILVLGCKTSVIPSTVKAIGQLAFEGCSGLTSISIPEGVTKIGSSAFADCTGLVSVTLPNSLTSIENLAFYGCINLASINVPNTITSLGDSLFDGTVWFENLDDGIITFGTYLYKYKGTMPANTSIVIPSNITTISENAFKDCTNLTSATISSNVKEIRRNAFDGCTGLKTLNILTGVEKIESYAFMDCSSLVSIAIPSTVVELGFDAFNGCKALASITVNSANTFYKGVGNCLIEKSSNKLILGCKNSVIPAGVTSIGFNAFYGCEDLTSLTLPDGIISIEYSAFEKCTKLTTINLPSTITSIDKNAFYGCIVLSSIVIPDGITSIAQSAFLGCYRLTSLTIPSSVTSVGNHAFDGVNSLTATTINFKGTKAQWDAITWGTGNTDVQNATINYNYQG